MQHRSTPLKITIFAAAAAISLALAGCSNSNNEGASANNTPSIPPVQSETASPAPTDSPAAATPDTQDNPYEAAGINDPAAFNKMFEAVKAAAAADDKETLADYVLYPLRVNIEGGESVTIDNKEQFIKQYDSVFTSSVKAALAAQEAATLFVNYKGVMAGNGQIWFGATADDPQQVGIIAVNVDAPANS